MDPRNVGTSFVDDFSAPQLDRSRWVPSQGWNNGAHQRCTWSADSVRLKGGILTLSIVNARSQDRDFTCGELQTTKLYGYGTYEVRMRVPKADGVVSAFHTYSHDDANQGIHLTFPGNKSDTALTNFVVGASNRNERGVELGLDAAEGMHDYAFEWLPGSLRWYVDGSLVREVTASDDVKLPSQPSKLHLHVWNAAIPEWLGAFTYSGNPVTLDIDRVAFTAQGGACQFRESIVCRHSAISLRSTTGAIAKP